MARNGQIPAIDSDGHFLERRQDIAKYVTDKFQGREHLWPGGQIWDIEMKGTLGTRGYGHDKSAAQQVEFWENVCDKHDIETAVLFPTGSGNMAKLQEPGFAEAATKAANIHFAKDYMTDRLKPVGVLPMRNPKSAIAELRRVAKLGLPGVEILTDGLEFALGDPVYDPVYAEAEKLGVAMCIHGTRHWAHEFGAAKLRSFAEVHCYAFPAGLILNFTSVMANGLPIKFPKLRLAFLEVGATWLPYYLARLDEHWEKRGHEEMPLLKKKPTEIFRNSQIKVSLEAGEPLLAETIDYVGPDHVMYASDIPHWDNEFPGNLDALRKSNSLSRETKEKILFRNARELFGL